MSIKIAESDAELARAGDVLLELRPGFTKDALIAQIRAQQQSGYRVAYLESAGEVLCVAGFVVGTKLAWGKHLYVDDLVTAERHRSTGAGKRMLDWLKAHALAVGCRRLPPAATRLRRPAVRGTSLLPARGLSHLESSLRDHRPRRIEEHVVGDTRGTS